MHLLVTQRGYLEDDIARARRVVEDSDSKLFRLVELELTNQISPADSKKLVEWRAGLSRFPLSLPAVVVMIFPILTPSQVSRFQGLRVRLYFSETCQKATPVRNLKHRLCAPLGLRINEDNRKIRLPGGMSYSTSVPAYVSHKNQQRKRKSSNFSDMLDVAMTKLNIKVT